MAGSSLVLAPDVHSGRRLGKYEILCRLSMGGMSELFLAFQKGLAGFRKFVVLKQILPDIKGEEEFVRMFLDEARITAAFTHPNIAQVFDLDIDDGELFLAMEFVPGATLVEVARACRLAGEPIPPGLTLMAVRDTALALHYAHTFTDPMGRAVQVIHRDVAEKNIMVTYDGTTKLLDFGIAKALGRASRTSVGMVKGTSGYMSPEQILGEPLDPRSDVFALGVVLHECLTGMRLFHAKTAEDAMMQALKAEVAPPSRQNPQVPPELDAVTLKALKRTREERYATALELARAIERVAGPLIWHPEQSAQLITRLFSDRREQTRQLMSGAQGHEHTGEFKLAKLFADAPPVPGAPQVISPPPGPPPIPPAPAVSADAPAPPRRPLPPEPPAPPKRAPLPPPVPTHSMPAVTRAAPIQTPPQEVTVLEHPHLVDPPRRRAPRPSGPRASLPPPVPDFDEAHFPPEERTLPGELPDLAALDRTNPRFRLPPRDEERTASVVETTTSGRAAGGGRGGMMMMVGVVAATLLAAVGVSGYALGLHEDLGEILGLDAPELAPKPPAAVPLGPVAVAPVPEGVAVAEAPEAAAERVPAAADTVTVVDADAVAVADVEPVPLVAEADAAALAEPAAETPAKTRARPEPKRTAVRARASRSTGSSAKTEPAAAAAAATDAEDDWGKPAVASPVKAKGTLTLITEPWSTVFLGGRELGITPVVKQELPAGRHTLRLVGPDKKAVSLPVQISAGEETKVRVPLSVLSAP